MFEHAPTVVLAHPQLGENIGMVARAMLNFGLTDLRLAIPRDGWPNEKAVSASAGAVDVIEKAKVFDSVEGSLRDLDLVFATSARPRDLLKPVLGPDEAAAQMHAATRQGRKIGVLFGGEKAGLHNDHVALADAVIHYPVNPAFASLNLAQAVLVLAYEWFKAGELLPVPNADEAPKKMATKAELLGFFEHLEDELDQAGFLLPVEKRPNMVRNLRTMFTRIGLYDQEVRTLRGIVKALALFSRGRRPEE